MALAARMLGGIGKTIVGAGGTVLKGGAKLFGDDAVEALGRGVGKAQKGLDDIVQAAVKQDEIYKTAKNEARGIKEAIKNTSDDAVEAVTRSNAKVTYSKDGDKFYRQVEGGKKQEIDSKLYGNANSRRISIDKANSPSHKNYTGDNYSNTFTMEEEVANTISKTAAGDGAGVDLLQFASNHPVGTALAGLGVGVVGANLLDDN